MSRDAKVGLVIIFSFVFLLGTIGLHRFHRTTAELPDTMEAPVVHETDPNGALGSPSGYGTGEPQVPASAVDAISADADTHVATRDQAVQSAREHGFDASPRRIGSRPPTELPSNQADGALISLTDGGTQGATSQPPAAVVEPTEPNAWPPPSSARVTGQPTRSSESSPLLEIRSPGEPSTTPPAARGDARSLEEPATTLSATETESPETAGASDLPDDGSSARPDSVMADGASISGANTASADPPMSRTLGNTPLNQSELAEPDTIQQAEGHRADGTAVEPPPLPRYESKQATIEPVVPGSEPFGAVESRQVQSDLRGKPELSDGDAAGHQDGNGQRSYVVKSGDSFWTISARHYGTGKYFRALEDFNRHRLAAYEDGRRILRPGTEILLPRVSVLRSKSAGSKSDQGTADKAPRDSKADFAESTDRIGETDPSAGSPVESRAVSGDTRVYRVQEGDSLSKIAQRELGAAKRWQEIYELNAEKLDGQHVLRIGMDLKLPPGRATEKLVERPATGR